MAERKVGVGGVKKTASLGSNQSGWRTTCFFFFFFFTLTPGNGGDRRLCMRLGVRGTGVYVRAHIVAGLIRQHFPGTREDVGEGPRGS